MKMKILNSLAILSLLGGIHSMAAAPGQFDYNATGHFIPGTEVGTTTGFNATYSNGNKIISWGNSDPQSSLELLPIISGVGDINGTHDEFGTLVHQNYPIFPPALQHVDINWTLKVPAVGFERSWKFTIYNWETDNSESSSNPCPRKTVGIVTDPANGHQYLGDGQSDSVCDDAHNFGESGDGGLEEKYLYAYNGTLYEIQISGFYDDQHKLTKTFWAAEGQTSEAHAGFIVYERGSDTAIIGDRVWIDLNNDGIQQPSETKGAAGLTMQLYKVGDTTPLQVVSTDANGNYHFSDVSKIDSNGMQIEYYIQVVCPPNVNAEFTVQGTGSALDSGTDNDVDANGKTKPFKLPLGESIIDTIDAGIKCGAIGDKVWVDSNMDGIQDPTEKGLPGVTVNLYNTANSNTPLRSTMTNDLGQYLFTINTSGEYFVEFELLTGYTFSPANQGTDRSLDSDADETSGRTGSINIVLEPGTENHYRNWDAGMVGDEPDDALPTLGEQTPTLVAPTLPNADDKGPDCPCNDVHSDSSSTFGTVSSILMMLMTLMAGLFFVRRETQLNRYEK